MSEGDCTPEQDAWFEEFTFSYTNADGFTMTVELFSPGGATRDDAVIAFESFMRGAGFVFPEDVGV